MPKATYEKPRRSLFWTVDEDGERVHRLASEWDGNKGNRVLWSRYGGEHDQAEVSVGTTWSRWAFGPEWSYSHSVSWDYRQQRSIAYRRTDFALSVGPWSLWITRCRPTDD